MNGPTPPEGAMKSANAHVNQFLDTFLECGTSFRAAGRPQTTFFEIQMCPFRAHGANELVRGAETVGFCAAGRRKLDLYMGPNSRGGFLFDAGFDGQDPCSVGAHVGSAST